jgi:hypothetical protein
MSCWFDIMQVIVLWYHNPFDFLLWQFSLAQDDTAELKLEKWVSAVDRFRSLVEIPSRDVVVAYNRWLWSLIIWHGNPVGSSVTALIFRDIRLLDQMSPQMLCSLIIQGLFFQLSGSTRSFKGAIVINFVFGVATQKQGKSLLVASQFRWSLPL